MDELEGLCHMHMPQLTSISSLTPVILKPKGFFTCTASIITKGHVLGIGLNWQSYNLGSRTQ